MSEQTAPARDTRAILKTIGKIALNVLIYVFMALCIVALVFALASKIKGDDAVTVFGKQMRIVVSESMSKNDEFDASGYDIKDIPLSSMVFIDTVPTDPEERAKWFEALEIGDVLTFKYVYSSQVTVTHRISGKVPNAEGGYTITLMGDNKAKDADPTGQVINTVDHETSPNYIIGKVTGQSKLFGKLISGLKTPIGIGLVVILPCAIIAILEIIKIVGFFTEDKRKKQEEEKHARESEIEELRRKLEAMEKKNAEADAKLQDGANGGNTESP